MVMDIIAVTEFVLGYALTFLLIAFGIWVYRKFELRSLPWALAYLVLGLISIIIFNIVRPMLSLIHQSISPSQHASSVKDMTTYMVLNGTWRVANRLLVAVLLLADCAVLITKAGGNLTGKFADFWRWVYDKSTIIGCVLIASILVRIIWRLLY